VFGVILSHYIFFAFVMKETVLHTCSNNLQIFLDKYMMCDKTGNSGLGMCIVVNWILEDICHLGWSKFLNFMIIISTDKMFMLDHVLWSISYRNQNLAQSNC
jgi:hypothetical protein